MRDTFEFKIEVDVNKMRQQHLENGGSTINRTGRNMVGEAYYSVGILPQYAITKKGRNVDAVDILMLHGAILPRFSDEVSSRLGVGTWYDETKDESTVEIIALFPKGKLNDAVNIGHYCFQKAIYDLEVGEVLWIHKETSCPKKVDETRLFALINQIFKA